jgi:hypothetical protein
MKTPLVIGAESAMSEHQKMSILSNEVIRRMSNISMDKSQSERTGVVDTFTRELKNSGYSRSKAREIVVCGLLGLERKKKRRKRERQPFHRPAKSTLNKRTVKKLNGKQSWFKPRDEIEEMEKRKENRERETEIAEGWKQGQGTERSISSSFCALHTQQCLSQGTETCGGNNGNLNRNKTEDSREGWNPTQEDISQTKSLGRYRLPERGLPDMPDQRGNRRRERKNMLEEECHI